ncbi:hypothetical protein QVD17_34851 [Tagetes erecta]|uniref:Transmembrane protein n=1 Tax=Tagetes erecta TaxID=13708 RepID=A0AAD8K4T0_TARER|nr:hypothetical protein QVD17_34851 [Tagetes erecta]
MISSLPSKCLKPLLLGFFGIGMDVVVGVRFGFGLRGVGGGWVGFWCCYWILNPIFVYLNAMNPVFRSLSIDDTVKDEFPRPLESEFKGGFKDKVAKVRPVQPTIIYYKRNGAKV